MGAKEIIADIMSLEERIAELRAALDGLPTAELERALDEQLREVLGGIGEGDPLPLSLVRLVASSGPGYQRGNLDCEIETLCCWRCRGRCRGLPKRESRLRD